MVSLSLCADAGSLCVPRGFGRMGVRISVVAAALPNDTAQT